MDEKIIKNLAGKSLVAMILVIVISINLSRYEYPVIYANDIEGTNANQYNYDKLEIHFHEKKDNIELTELDQLNIQSSVEGLDGILPDLSDEYLIIPKQGEGTLDDITILDCFMTRSVKITINGVEASFFIDNTIFTRIDGNAEIRYLEEEHSNQTVTVEVVFDKLYAYNIKEDNEYYYVELLDPRLIYDKIIVIDAGHGGTAVGTNSLDMMYYEKDINLSIVLYLKQFLDKEDIKVYYTRLEDDKYLLEPRVSLANELMADMFISIHCNGDIISQSNGLEVLYGGSSKKVKNKSKDLASVCLNEIIKYVDIRNRGIVERNEKVYILRNSIVPVALIEAGFMTNSQDIVKLIDKEYQKNVARGIYDAILEGYK